MEQAPDKTILEAELLIIRHSGEIPEVALHGSIFFLTRDPQGPRLALGEDDFRLMKEKVVERYLEMIDRDLEPENRNLCIYRGLARCAINWQRMSRFCSRESISMDSMKENISKRLILFIKIEKGDVKRGKKSSINCCENTLGEFAESLGLNLQKLPAGWQELCHKDPQKLPFSQRL